MKKKFASQIAPKASWKNAILLAMTALALCSCAAVALADDCTSTATWTPGSIDNNWCDPGNWSGGQVPDFTTATQINTGTAQIYTDACMADACSLTLGLNASDSGTVQVMPAFGDLSVGEAISVGYRGTGNLTITQGTVTSATASIASLASDLFTSNGVVKVDGPSTWAISDTISVGQGGSGSLSVTNGGTVTSAGGSIASLAGSNGSLTVDGTGSTWTVSGEADVGGTTSGAGGTGLLTVTNGGTIRAGTSVHVWNSGTLTGNGTVSVNSGSGTVTVDGTLAPSGTLTISGNLTFGLGANMSCNVSSTSVDNAQVSGRALLHGKLSVTVNVTGDFTLLHAGQGRNGTKFDSYSFTYTGCLFASVSYQDNGDGSSDVILHVVSTCH